MKVFFCFCFSALLCFFSGCTDGPVVKGGGQLKLRKEFNGKYRLTLSFALKNSHEDLVLGSVSGKVNIYDNKSHILISHMEFKSGDILPLKREFVFADTFISYETFMSIVNVFEVDMSEFTLNGEEYISLKKVNLSVEIINFNEFDIVDYLKEKDKNNEKVL